MDAAAAHRIASNISAPFVITAVSNGVDSAVQSVSR
jgi:hypothetical protein